MAALSLRGKADPARAAHVLDVRNHAIAEYFISEVLERQAPDVARFMLEVSILSECRAAACAAVTGRQDAAALLRGMHAPTCSWWHSTMSGRVSGTTIWCGRC
jgi:ATP/maltotriose-dependent transcriptional regulator MalT